MSYHLPWLLAAAFIVFLSTMACASETGLASWYGWHENGHAMADGRPFRALGPNAASRTLPLGTRAKVINLENGRVTEVLIEDRGPYVGHRILDVSLGTARILGMDQKGLARVLVEPMGEVVKIMRPKVVPVANVAHRHVVKRKRVKRV